MLVGGVGGGGAVACACADAGAGVSLCSWPRGTAFAGSCTSPIDEFVVLLGPAA